jgi:hypothetical protein
MNLRRWLRPGIGIKRWLVVAFVGLTGLALAGALALRQLYRDVEVEGPFQAAISIVTLQFLPYWVRAGALLAAGIFLFGYGSYRVIRALLGPFTESAEEPLVDLVYRRRLLARGPRIVAIGGGTGLSALLRGLKEHTANLTAIVSVADGCASSWVSRRSATSATAWSRWRRPRRRWGSCSSTASARRRGASRGTPWATS